MRNGELQKSGTTANLRGIHSVDGSIAWASGTEGTVLRTEDGGTHWQKCAVPPGADKLDFRGVWAWDANSAMVLSSGPGDQSRIYETKDGGWHWIEKTKNDEKDGFWDVMSFQTADFGMLGDMKTGMVIGDPVQGRFYTMAMLLGHGWFLDEHSCAAAAGEAAFAASNTSIFVFGSRRYILVTGGTSGARALLSPLRADREHECLGVPLLLAGGAESSGAFSVFFRSVKQGVTVGGDYKKPNEADRVAAWTADGGRHWTASKKMPHGYRSAVAWDAASKAWITVCPNGADISKDVGKTWQRLSDDNWNGLSLPFVVGPKGSIAKLSPTGVH